MEPRLLKSKTDWHWYKKARELEYHSEDHADGEPETYPCMARSWFEDGDYDDHKIHHRFLYEDKIKCDHCGHEKKAFPEETEWSRGITITN